MAASQICFLVTGASWRKPTREGSICRAPLKQWSLRMCSTPPSAPIRLLPQTLAIHLDSLSIIPNPLAIVKALVENSLDAKASAITVQLLQDKIVVVDDGSGIQRGSMGMLGVKHASSKSGATCDGSLGFRGVSLAAIRSSWMVEEVTVKSREVMEDGKRETVGWEVTMNGTRSRRSKGVVMKGGTAVEVKLKPDVGTGALVRSVRKWVERLMCLWTTVEMEVFDKKRLVWWIKKSEMLERVSSLMGVRNADTMSGEAQIKETGGTVDVVVGKFLKALNSMKKGKQLCVGVNGRVVEHEGWEELIESITREKRIINECGVNGLPIFVRVQTGLDEIVLGSPASSTAHAISKDPENSLSFEKSREPELGVGIVFGKLRRARSYEAALRRALDSALVIANTGHPFSFSTLYSSRNIMETLATQVSEDRELAVQEDLSTAVRSNDASAGTDVNGVSSVLNVNSLVPGLSTMKVVAQVLNTYIVVERDGGILLIEQHTADERVKFEYILKRWTSKLVPLARPLRLPEQLKDYELSNLDALGFQVRESNYKDNHKASLCFVITSVPSFLADLECESLSAHIKALSKATDHEEAAATIACRLAVKNGRRLRLSDMGRIVRGLSRCRAPHLCPHGRPIFVEVDEKELASAFKRNWTIQKSREKKSWATSHSFPLPRRGIVS